MYAANLQYIHIYIYEDKCLYICLSACPLTECVSVFVFFYCMCACLTVCLSVCLHYHSGQTLPWISLKNGMIIDPDLT